MFIPLKNHSTYTLQKSISKPWQIIRKCIKSGYDTCGITDSGSLAGTVQFLKACQEGCECGEPKSLHLAGKRLCVLSKCQEFRPKKIKPILGTELFVNGKTLTVLAKNKDGWKELVKLCNESNFPENFNIVPQISLNKINTKNLS